MIDDYFQICSLLRGGIAERGGVRVGHRIIEINGQSVVAVPHERIVNLLATSVGEVRESRKYFSIIVAHHHPLVINKTKRTIFYILTDEISLLGKFF